MIKRLLTALLLLSLPGVANASTSWDRITSATNFSDLENGGFDEVPMWGIYPREIGEEAGSTSSRGVGGTPGGTF